VLGLPAIVFDRLRFFSKTGDLFSMEQGIPDRDIWTFLDIAMDKDRSF
jgi:hypothetical protein